MKTKNNVQKAILKSAAVIVSLVLISFTVNAQNFWKSLLENETFSQIAMAMVADDLESNDASHDANHISDAALYAEYSVIEPEESLTLENWMTSETVFTAETDFEAETEVPMELENWMTNENLFNVPAPAFTAETETALEVENWMVDEYVFDNVQETKELLTANLLHENVQESTLELENWMVNKNVWN